MTLITLLYKENASKSYQLTSHCSSFRNQQTFNDVVKTSKWIKSVTVIYIIDLYLIKIIIISLQMFIFVWSSCYSRYV